MLGMNTCLACGAEIGRRAKFCSSLCCNRYNAQFYVATDRRKAATKAAQAVANTIFLGCPHCDQRVPSRGFKQHVDACYLSPSNRKNCPLCARPIRNYKTGKTCSHACANKQFRSGRNNGNWKEDAYRTTCFEVHEKICVVCGESNIVEVHHFDGDHDNNSADNLVPLCPTHHKYCHSRFYALIKPAVDDYVKNRISECGSMEGRLLWEQENAGSSPVTPTTMGA